MREITIIRNGHTIALHEGKNGYVYVCNLVRDQDGFQIDLAAGHSYDGYPIERRFPSMSTALHFMGKCVRNAF